MGKNISANKVSLKYLFNKQNKGLYIPSYQRNYAWTEENIKKIFNDLLEHYETNKDKDYYMGNIIIKEKKHEGKLFMRLLMVNKD